MGKQFLGKVASTLCRYPVGQTFCQNRSILLCFQDKLVFALNAELEDGHQKWRENDFWKKWLIDFPDTLWVKHFVKIAPSRSVSKINVLIFFVLRRNSRWPPKVAGK